MKSNVFRAAQDRPLMSLSETRRQGGKPKRSKDTVDQHSKRSAEQSKRYHARIVGADPAKVQRMNPTKVIPAARSFPGLIST